MDRARCFCLAHAHQYRLRRFSAYRKIFTADENYALDRNCRTDQPHDVSACSHIFGELQTTKFQKRMTISCCLLFDFILCRLDTIFYWRTKNCVAPSRIFLYPDAAGSISRALLFMCRRMAA